jgi:hypothetical protein
VAKGAELAVLAGPVMLKEWITFIQDINNSEEYVTECLILYYIILICYVCVS